uniref:hypothetical protein n=1 Tax=Aeromonas hydrophila TaxID=644 RepID=UPI002B485605
VLNIAPRLPLKLRGAKCLDLQGANLENPLLTPAGNYRVHADKIYVTDESGDFPDPSECEVIVCETELSAP